MTILPKLRCKFGEGVGVELFISPPDIRENESTFINTDYASGVSAFAVDNGLKFSVDEYGVVGNIGAEMTEIVRTHDLTAPTATTITLASATEFAHSRGDIFQTIPYNEVVIERSTDSGVNYSVLATISIRVDSTETYYNYTTGTSTDYYRIRFKNSADTTYSSYSDEVLSTGFSENSAGSLIRDVLVSLGETIDNEVMTKEFLFAALHEGREEIDNHERVSRWSFRTDFDYNLGAILPGTFEVEPPADLRDPQSYKNILSLRIGRDNQEVTPVDKRAINKYYEGIAHTTTTAVMNDTDITIVLTSSGDFDEAGAIDLSAEDIDGTIDNVSYTSNDESTDTLAGVTGIITGGHSAGADVWQGASFGSPQEYTVSDGYITFSEPFEDDLAGENIWIDYYKKLVKLNSDEDTFDEPFYGIYKPYMRYRIKARKNPQLDITADPDYRKWVEMREASVNKEFSGQDTRFIIDVPC